MIRETTVFRRRVVERTVLGCVSAVVSGSYFLQHPGHRRKEGFERVVVCNRYGADVDAADKIPCGGLKGLQCPKGWFCVDDPEDKCDPANGGRDCIGVCVPGISTGV